jgi:hypothetical protein
MIAAVRACRRDIHTGVPALVIGVGPAVRLTLFFGIDAVFYAAEHITGTVLRSLHLVLVREDKSDVIDAGDDARCDR